MRIRLKLKIWEDIVETVSIQKRLKTRKTLFFVALICSVFVTYLQLEMIKLLQPLIAGIISQDFTAVKDTFFYQIANRYCGIDLTTNGKLLLLVSCSIYLVTFLKGLVGYVSTLAMGRYSTKAAKNVRELLFKTYLDFGKAYYDKSSVGELTTVMSGAVKSFASQMNKLLALSISVLSAILYLGILINTAFYLTMLVLVIVLLSSKGTRRLASKIQSLAQSKIAVEKKFGTKLNDVLSGVVLVKGFNKEADEIKSFKDDSYNELKVHWSMLRWEGLLPHMYDLSSTTTFLFVALGMSSLDAISKVGAANLLVFVYVVQQFIPSINRIAHQIIDFQKSSVWNLELNKILNDVEKYKVSEGERELDSIKNGIKVKNLDFSYVANKKVLCQLNCEIQKGEKVALVGPSGAGKTTLMNLLLRMYDCPADSIFVDGCDVRDFKISSIRDKMAFVSQDVFLFDASIMFNLTYGTNKEFNMERVLELAQLTKVDAFVRKLENGYDTMVGEKGAKLSGGERQRIALTRALLRDAAVIMLDEPTSALDNSTEKEVVKNLSSLLQDKTVITIAHRLSTIQTADRILFLNKGAIQAVGKFDDLVREDKNFAEFVNAEFKAVA